ncbi:SMI1/KNR4 family protein [Ruminococcus sp.]|uniref:SMI1/KNR4 family protein n=1 Tax=Ruminococcus sp. TaxID=41978 RepID=UPI0025D801B9|nr:SMI1/KNR4 family protein [Ruminococcus sp.]MBQ8965891.1 SMI1/KNR4 family protein [Ruminococcus sp.]
MTLEQLERQQEVTYPAKFREIYDRGGMNWLTLSRGEFKERLREYAADSKAFLMMNCDCEMSLFEDVQALAEELAKLAQWQQEDKHVSIKKGLRIVPFGRSGGGDVYCLLYREGMAEAQVIIFSHDGYEAPRVMGHDFDEFIYIQLLLAAENDEDIEGENFMENLGYLSGKYRAVIQGKSAEELTDELFAMNFEEADIWE